MKVTPVPLEAAGDLSALSLSDLKLTCLLRFPTTLLEERYQTLLRTWPAADFLRYSTLRERLFAYYLLVMLALGVDIIGAVATYYHSSLERVVINTQTAGFVAILSLNVILLSIVYNYQASWKPISTLLVVSYLATVLLFTLIDPSVVSTFVSNVRVENAVISVFLPILVVIAGASQLFIGDFFAYAVTSGVATVCFVCIELAANGGKHPISAVLEFAGLIGVISLITRQIYTQERINRLQFLSELQENPKKHSFSSNDPSSISLNTDWEEILARMQNAHTVITEACSMIVYQDLRAKLKSVGRDLDVITSKLSAEGPNIFQLKLEHVNHEIDADDKKFVQENFMSRDFSSLGVKATSQRLVEQQTVNPNMFMEYKLSELISVLNQMGKNWNFDMFFVQEVTEGKALSVCGRFCLSKFGLGRKLGVSEMVAARYFDAVESAYKPNPYHNSCHGADVLNSILYFYHNSEIITFLTDLEILASVIAGLGHDVGHSALNNRFLVNKRDDLALTYNDFSVLEMMHASLTFSLMQVETQNILESLDAETWPIVRKVVVKMILATDMTRHFDLLGTFRSTHMTASTSVLGKADERLNVFEIAIKCADIGHAAKGLELHEKWTLLVIEEFFYQGDLEKRLNLPVSMFCDRTNTDIPKVGVYIEPNGVHSEHRAAFI